MLRCRELGAKPVRVVIRCILHPSNFIQAEDQMSRSEEEQSNPLPEYSVPKNPPVIPSKVDETPRPGQAESSSRGLVGRGPPAILYGKPSMYPLYGV